MIFSNLNKQDLIYKIFHTAKYSIKLNCSKTNEYKSSPGRLKYISYNCNENFECGGHGDRIKGIISTYIWSLITNRKFLINITKPCDLKNFLLPNKINWNEALTKSCDLTDSNEELSQISVVDLWGLNNNKFKENLKFIDILKFHEDKDLIILRTNRNYLTSYSRNKYVKISLLSKGLDPKFLDIPFVMKKIYSDLFKLTPRLQLKYDEFLKRAKPSPKTILICAQVRIGGFLLNNNYDLKFINRNDSFVYWKFIKENFLTKINSSSYRIFITTDTESIEKEAELEFGKNNIVVNSGVNVHVDDNQVKNCSTVEKIILDFHSLANCDMAVISGSQFGTFGIWNRDDPIKDAYWLGKDLNFVKLTNSNILNWT